MGRSCAHPMTRGLIVALALMLLPAGVVTDTQVSEISAAGAEQATNAEQRVSERLRHKDRAASTGWSKGSREVLLDNAAVQVVRLSYPPGSESGMHGHDFPNRVIYVVQGGVLEMIQGDSTKPSRTLEVSTGQAVYAPAATHNVRNVGDSVVVLIETELK